MTKLTEAEGAYPAGWSEVLRLADVLEAERRQIHGEDDWQRQTDKRLSEIYRDLHRHKHAALCLSGGGIRSAAFALGVIQAFAAFPDAKDKPKLIQRFHYLSTVSGGGYIGSWFTAWLSRKDPTSHESAAASEVIGCIARREADVEPVQITNLRENTGYLTPHAGLFSGDMWAAIATIVRNLLLNWMVVLPLLVCGVLAAKLVAAGIFGLSEAAGIEWILGAVAVVGLVVATAYRVANRPSMGAFNLSATWFYLVHAPFALVSALAIAILVDRDASAQPAIDLGDAVLRYAVVGAVLYGIAWLLGWGAGQACGLYNAAANRPTYKKTDWAWWTLSGAAFGVLVALLEKLHLALEADWRLRALVIAGPPVIILAQMTAEICFVGLISRTQADDDDREWLARAGGSYVLLSLVGSAFFALVLLAPMTYEGAEIEFTAWLASVGGVTGLLTAALGASKLTTSEQDGNATSKEPKRLPFNLIVKLGAPLFGAALIVAASLLLDELLFRGLFEHTGLFGEPRSSDPTARTGVEALRALGFALAISALLLWFIPWRVNVNRFSIHSFYRNRLTRAFLAASRTTKDSKRQLHRPYRNRFTDVDPDDNVPMHELWDRNKPPVGESWRPFHVVNMALNIVSSHNTAWQERKAEPFTVTPLHAGSGCIAFEEGDDARTATQPGASQPRDFKPGAFQPVEYYGGIRGYGLSLGTAMAISGAAASPNMGYHSSPAVTFLMALFNVRLGWWLANPGTKGRGAHDKFGPGWALGPFLSEMFGRTSDDRRYVYLSDGGHFENLGLYEMVRRRCRYVVVSDASQDKDFQFGSLGNAVRKIGIDLGIRVEMIGLDALKKRSEERQTPGETGPYHAMGLIHYADVDGDDVADGILLYIKSGLHWTESADVQNYASSHPLFPHESTGNQWFTESQFESYRRLALDITWPILEQAASGSLRYPHPEGLEQMLEVLLDQARARRRAV